MLVVPFDCVKGVVGQTIRGLLPESSFFGCAPGGVNWSREDARNEECVLWLYPVALRTEIDTVAAFYDN